MRDQQRVVRLRVGRNIRRLRQLRGLSQEGLAELAGNSWKNMGRIERGQSNVGIDVLSRVAAALSVDIADLFAGGASGRRAGDSALLMTPRELAQIELVARRVRTRAGRSSRR